MRTGELICENTHAKFLNNLLKIHLHNYRQCTYKLNNGYVIWMLRLSGVESTTGWTNTLTDSGNTILEDYTGNPFKRHPSHKTVDCSKRLVFDIEETAKKRKYIFRGVFSYDFNSNNDRRKWNKTSDVFCF